MRYVALMLVLVFAGAGFGVTKYVSHSGSDGADGSLATPYRTILKGIAAMTTQASTLNIVTDSTYIIETVQNGTAGEIKAGELTHLYVDSGKTPSASYVGKCAFVDGVTSDGYGYVITAAQAVDGGYYTVSRAFVSDAATLTWRIGDQDFKPLYFNRANISTSKSKTVIQGTNGNRPTILRTQEGLTSWGTPIAGDVASDAIMVINANNVIVQDIIFQSDFASLPTIFDSMLLATHAQGEDVKYNLGVIRCKFVSTTGYARNGLGCHTAYCTSVIGCELVGLRTTGIYMTDAVGMYVYGNYLHDWSGNNTTGVTTGIHLDSLSQEGSPESGFALIENNIISNITAAGGTGAYGIHAHNGVIARNNTIYGITKTSDGTGTGIYIADSDPAKNGVMAIMNNIVMQAKTGYGSHANVGTLYFDYNCYYSTISGSATYSNFTAGTHDLVVNPQFLNPTAGDFKLSIGSPCLNMGATSSFAGGKTSIGAWQPYAIPAVSRTRPNPTKNIYSDN